jgi:hypothetical protein
MQCALLTPPDHREAAGKDEEGEPACRKHAVDLPVIVVQPAPATAMERSKAICTGCGRAFSPSRAWQKQCNPACRQEAYRKRQAESEATPPAPTAVVAEAEEENGMKEGRQEKIVALAKEGKSYAQISKALGIAVGTISYYMRKAGASKPREKRRKPLTFQEPGLDSCTVTREELAGIQPGPGRLPLADPKAGSSIGADLVNEIWNVLPYELKRQVLRNAL